MPNKDGLTAVGAHHLPEDANSTALQPDDKKAREMRDEQATDAKGGPLTQPHITHPTETVEVTPAYRRADGSTHDKES